MRFVRSCPPLLWGAIVAAGSSLGLSMIEANMIVYLVHVRHQPVAAVGVVFAALGLGSLTGALLTPRLLRVFRPGSLIIGCVLTGGSFTALLAVLPGCGRWIPPASGSGPGRHPDRAAGRLR
jgi:MFS family permease